MVAPRKSYAEAVRSTGRRSDPAVAVAGRVPEDDDDDEWTDVSSMMSCSWPSVTAEEGSQSGESTK